MNEMAAEQPVAVVCIGMAGIVPFFVRRTYNSCVPTDSSSIRFRKNYVHAKNQLVLALET